MTHTEKTSEEPVELGGNIQLSGFSGLDGARLVVVKKMVGNYAKKISASVKNFEKIALYLKEVHKKEPEQDGVFEVHSKILYDGKISTTEVSDHNLFFAIDKSLKKLENMLEH